MNNSVDNSTKNSTNNFVNDLSDRLDRTRAVISWIENNASRIAQGWRLAVSLVNAWNAVGDLHIRLA